MISLTARFVYQIVRCDRDGRIAVEKGNGVSPLLIGSLGVGLLLLAFVLNVLKRIDENGSAYLVMNTVGAGLSCYYAWVSGIIPFVVLEGVWAGAALVRLISVRAKKGSPSVGEPR